jgi:hypothetical protein
MISEKGGTIMFSRDFSSVLDFLMGEYCLPPESMVFVDDIAAWCREQGISEPDSERPMKMTRLGSNGCIMLIRRQISDEAVAQRMNALSVRNQLKNNVTDIADRLNSDKKKLAYLFLIEYAATLPEISGDEHLADAWAFKEMERLGFFRE